MPKTFISKERAIPLIVLTGLVVLSFALWSWFSMVYSSPSAVFERMLNTSFSTAGVTKHSYQNQEGQELTQSMQLATIPDSRVHAKSILRQGKDGGTVISTESIGTIPADYVRYTDIKTDQKTAEGKEFNFSSVIGIWGKADAEDPYSGGAQLFNQTVLGVVPFGNLPAGPRKQLISQIRESKMFATDYTNVKREIVDGRPHYTYDVSITPVDYIAMLKIFARELGIKDLERVDPSQYEGSPPIKFDFEVDVWSGQLLGIEYQGTDRRETYGGYGARVNIQPPNANVTAAELQSRLQQAQ
jgi:hypothetical protein